MKTGVCQEVVDRASKKGLPRTRCSKTKHILVHRVSMRCYMVCINCQEDN
jgi:hypothetical protein